MEKQTKSKGFRSLLATLFFGAFNDNAFKLVIAMIAIDLFADQAGGTKYLSLSGAALLIPFILFSTYAGFLADRFSKKQIIVWTKVFEIFVMIAGLFALIHGNIWGMLGVLFVMGAQSAFFSPSKYGILPEIFKEEELSFGNGLVQMWSNIAIILGTAVGGYLVYITKPDIYQASYFFIGISLVGVVSSLFVTDVKPSGSKRPFKLNFFKEVFQNIKEIRKDRPVFLSMMGLAYFGFLGALFQLNILLYAKKIMGMNDFQTSLLLVVLALGLGAGGVLAGKLSDEKVELGLVPLGAIGLTVFSLSLGFIPPEGIYVCVCLFALGISAGFYVVPLNALMQLQSPEDQRGKVLATNNFLSFSAMLVGSGALYLFRENLGINAAQIFIAVGVITIFGTGYVISLLPLALVRFVVWMMTHTIYRIRIINRKVLPKNTGALLVSNHISYIDAMLIIAATSRSIHFLVERSIYNARFLNPLFKLTQAIPVSARDEPEQVQASLDQAKEYIKQGGLVCIFAEGQLTRTGNILKFRKGLERIMKGVQAPIIPVHLDRVWGSIFSFEGGKFHFKKPKKIPYPVTVSFGDRLSPLATAFEVRSAVLDLGSDAFQYRLEDKRTLGEAFIKEAKIKKNTFCIADSSGKRLTYRQALIGAISLKDQLKAHLENQDNVGIVLPPSIAGSLTNIAVTFLNKIPVNINYTTSTSAITSIVDQCEMPIIISSRKFLEKTGLKLPGKILFVEDVFENISLVDKLWALCCSHFLSYRSILGKDVRRMDDLATIMFTSGSTGEPKGVMLTHANITSNLEGLYQVFHVKDDDVLMGVLPLFHSFGFTASLWFPLISGIGAVYHANPLDAKMIGKLVLKYQATILMSTPTFLTTYMRRCTEDQFKSLRIVVVGAEKLKKDIAQKFDEKFGVMPMEGYGCTELSPIVSINLPDVVDEGRPQKAFKEDKIGMPLPGIAVKVVHQETGDRLGPNENGLLFVKGPNVMKGYLKKEDLTREAIQNGWYATGDIANMDEDGFLMITDRLSRFSKIAGEMVPHIKVEDAIHHVLDATDMMCVVTSVSDVKKGERLVVLHLKDMDVEAVVAGLKTSDLPNLWIPDEKSFHVIDAVPILGTGKVNLNAIKELAKEFFKE